MTQRILSDCLLFSHHLRCGLVSVAISSLSSSTASTTVTAFGVVGLFDGDVDLCDCLESEDGNACPSAGDYTLREFGGIDIPGDDSAFYANSGYFGGSIPIKAKFAFDDGSTITCTTAVVLSNNNGTTAVSLVVLVGLAAALGIRKRRVATIQLAEDEGTNSHFEMMPNGDSVQV